MRRTRLFVASIRLVTLKRQLISSSGESPSVCVCFCIYCSVRDNAAAAKQSHVRFLAICGGSRRDGPGGGVSGAAATGAPEARTENQERCAQAALSAVNSHARARSALRVVCFTVSFWQSATASIFGFLSGVALRTQEYGHLARISQLLFGQFLVSLMSENMENYLSSFFIDVNFSAVFV